jgi:hypothetical protein
MRNIYTMLKSLCDLTQILLGYGPAGFAVLAFLALQGGKMFCRAWRLGWAGAWLVGAEARRWVVRLSGWGLVWNLLAGTALYFVFSAFGPKISDSIQWAEQTWLTPIYLAPIEADTSSEAAAAYTRRIGRNLGPSDYALFLRRTAEIAAKCGSTPLCFYEVYESECSCNPFAINQRERRDKAGRLAGIDTVAAGQIQFTAAGVSGLVLNGEAVTMRQVKDAIIHKRLGFLMDLQELYMARASGGKPLPRPCDVYTAVFMPAFVGKGMETVLASRWSNRPEYYWQNLGLDGYQLDGKGRVLFMPSSRDGVITIKDLSLCLAAKKAAVCRADKRN